ncbi:hypothetical protein MAR_035025 [Mya arenaria]|uniref:Uncharacterized protein n=1 Tax=Mya arenaria TaxID=6604 RepID=A0ABY7ENI3_MYAAR|nr:hypothetical protein MAR_035025 [Mya arenaria]
MALIQQESLKEVSVSVDEKPAEKYSLIRESNSSSMCTHVQTEGESTILKYRVFAFAEEEEDDDDEEEEEEEEEEKEKEEAEEVEEVEAEEGREGRGRGDGGGGGGAEEGGRGRGAEHLMESSRSASGTNKDRDKDESESRCSETLSFCNDEEEETDINYELSGIFNRIKINKVYETDNPGMSFLYDFLAPLLYIASRDELVIALKDVGFTDVLKEFLSNESPDIWMQVLTLLAALVTEEECDIIQSNKERVEELLNVLAEGLEESEIRFDS